MGRKRRFKVEIPVSRYFISYFEGDLRFWVLGLRSSFSTHPPQQRIIYYKQ